MVVSETVHPEDRFTLVTQMKREKARAPEPFFRPALYLAYGKSYIR